MKARPVSLYQAAEGFLVALTGACDQLALTRLRGRPVDGIGAYISSCTERMLPAGSLNQAIVGPGPRAMPFSSCSKPS